MLKNVHLKKILKILICKSLSTVNKHIQKQDNIILLYSGNKGISYNLKPLLEYLLQNNFNDKYRIVLAVENKKHFGECFKNIVYVTHLPAVKYYFMAKHVFYTAGQLPIKPANNQIVIHLNHGISDYKTVGALTKINNGDEFFFSYMITSSPLYIPIVEKEYLCPKECIKVMSEPMVDRLIMPKNQYSFENYKKILLWVPTFRQSDYFGYNDSKMEELIPLFSETDYPKLNEKLKDLNFLLIVKLHPGQNLHTYKNLIFSNLKIYSHIDFEDAGYNLYDLMAQCSCLIGDYSSVSLQFLLTNKPLAFVIPDYEEYSKKRGFVFEDAKAYMPGWQIYSIEQFGDFLIDMYSETDIYREERLKIKDLVHYYQDGNSCQRILNLSHISK